MKLKISAILLAGLISSPAFAGDAGTSYIGLQYAQTSYEDDANVEVDPSALVGRFGYFVTDYFSLETRAGFGIGDDEAEWDGYSTGVNVEIDYLFGAYGVGHLPINDMLSVYALAGFTQGEFTAEAGPYSYSDDDSGFSYGIGGQANFTPAVAATVEYTSYLDKSDYEISAISAGLNYQF